VPEPVELRVRGGERRRMTMPERDDRDPADQIEVLLSFGSVSTQPLPSTNETSARA
jgi:hypothetical protein